MKKINVYKIKDGISYITEDLEFMIGDLDMACHLMTDKEWKNFSKIGCSYLDIWLKKKINFIEISEEKFKELFKYV